MKKGLLIASVLIQFVSLSQTPFKLIFSPKVEGLDFELNQVVTDKNGKKMSIDHFDYYISHLHIIHDGGQDLNLADTVFLVEFDNYILDLGVLNVNQVESIQFGVGVPAELNHTDITAYPANHPLSFQDPSMQWGWSAGYMHMIVGGLSDGDNNQIPESYFEIHNLGDGNYYEIEVPVGEVLEQDNSKSINLDCNLDTWIGTTDLANNGIQHGENGVNFNVMKNVSMRPVFTADANANVEQKNVLSGKLYFTKNANSTSVKWSEVPDLFEYKLIDANGALIQQNKISGSSGEVSFFEIKTGVYFIEFYTKNNQLINKLKIIL